MKNDLNYLGFHRVVELKHGETMELAPDLSITSYQIWMFLDSAALIQCNGITLLNLNDSKHMGPTLQQIIRKHPAIDFVFRSHSSANERLSYTIVDEPDTPVDDIESYIEDFANTVRATGARYAIPFASNHCHLHKDSWHFNDSIQHPGLVQQYFSKNNITYPEVQVMASGDSWNSSSGFRLSHIKWFENREQHLLKYLNENQETLNSFYLEEDKAIVDPAHVQRYFKKLSRALPLLVRYYFRKARFTYVLKKNGRPAYIFEVNIATGKVRTLDINTVLSHTDYPIQIHTTAFIFLRSIEFGIFSHMSNGKRVFYKVTKHHKKFMEMLNLVFNFYEYDMLPWYRNLRGRSVESWMMRWREIWLYAMFARDLMFGDIEPAKYLKPVFREEEIAEQSISDSC